MRYGIRAVPPIHIIVENGRATLKGIVANEMDKQLAYMRARGVPGLFDVRNELTVEKRPVSN
ncbi:MAG: BON domain-containing protein [Acidobacteria bacterium]|nr:BON domain-containing protein [Acidobacteriota bacterium]